MMHIHFERRKLPQYRAAYQSVHLMRGVREVFPYSAGIHFECRSFRQCLTLHKRGCGAQYGFKFRSHCDYRADRGYAKYLLQLLDQRRSRFSSKHYIESPIFLANRCTGERFKYRLYMRQSRFLESLAVLAFDGHFAKTHE
ncbi:hypothetical protein D3C81_862490 [compost metagenome]